MLQPQRDSNPCRHLERGTLSVLRGRHNRPQTHRIRRERLSALESADNLLTASRSESSHRLQHGAAELAFQFVGPSHLVAVWRQRTRHSPVRMTAQAYREMSERNDVWPAASSHRVTMSSSSYRAIKRAILRDVLTSVTGRFFAHVLAREVRAIGTFRMFRSADMSAYERVTGSPMRICPSDETV